MVRDHVAWRHFSIAADARLHLGRLWRVHQPAHQGGEKAWRRYIREKWPEKYLRYPCGDTCTKPYTDLDCSVAEAGQQRSTCAHTRTHRRSATVMDSAQA
eukprot:4883362-Pleurochrysis_carterae.AAC.1